MVNNITVSKIHETDLDVASEQNIADLIKRTYGTVDFGGRTYFQQRHHFRLLAHIDGELASHVAILFRTVRLGQELFDVMGIAEVATASNFRRQGLATLLVKRALEEAKQSPAQFVLLFGTESLYKEIGFIPAQNPMTYIDLNGCKTGELVKTDQHALMVCAVSNQKWDRDKLLDLLGHIF